MTVRIVLREIKNVPGALLRVSEPFVKRGVELNNLTSEPRKGVLWEYIFTLEFGVEVGNEIAAEEAISELAKLGVCCTVESVEKEGE